jgi:flavin-dependent dehydrogenase
MTAVRSCDVIVVGGGPAGSSCAWLLEQSGLDVVVVDRSNFPRDKVCAGWITPQVLEDLRIDVDEYRRDRTFQPFDGFRVGIIGDPADVSVDYGRPVSFGIRRCEFDHYLLRRSGASLMLGGRVEAIRRSGAEWVVNELVKAPMLVGAGGHFCPVAGWLNGPGDGARRAFLVSAQEVEFAAGPDPAGCRTAPSVPELFFCRDLTGYGWVVRKQDFLNVGFGRLDGRSLPRGTAELVAFLEARGAVPRGIGWRWRGHAYLVRGAARRRAVDHGVLLVGDSAGLAFPQSGEGIRPAIESGLLAAMTIVEAAGRYGRDRLQPYADRLAARFPEPRPHTDRLARLIPAALSSAVAGQLLRTSTFVRHIVLDRWFLHAGAPALRVA